MKLRPPVDKQSKKKSVARKRVITDDILARARGGARKPAVKDRGFVKPWWPPGVEPPEGDPALMAMDEGFSAALAFAAENVFENTFGDGLQFLGYPFLAELSQRPEYRKISNRLATEMVREWIEFTATNTEGGEDKTEKIKELNEEFERLCVRDRFMTIAEKEGYFGRMHLFIELEGVDFNDKSEVGELSSPIGDGLAKLSKEKCKKGALTRLVCVEPMWTYPTNYNANNPLAESWYNPMKWLVFGNEIDSSRLLKFVGREVPDMLKPAYAFGGLSLSQQVKPYVDKWLRTANSVADMLDMFSIVGIKTDMMTQLSGVDPGEFFNRLDLMNLLRQNRGLVALDKNDEEFFQFVTSLATLDVLQAQAQEHCASAVNMPLILYTGLQPAGLNASSEGEIKAWNTWVHAYQVHLFSANLTKIMRFAMLNIWGKVDKDITFRYKPLGALDELGKATVRKTEADTDVALVGAGIVSEEESRKRIASDPESPYQGMVAEDVPETDDDTPELDENGEPVPPPPEGEPGEEKPTESPVKAKPGEEATSAEDGDPFGASDEEFKEGDHPRSSDGKFGSGGGGAKAALKPSELTKVGAQMGSNPGGVFKDKSGQEFYVKKGQSRDHVTNELTAAALMNLAGSPTLDYHPVEGGGHIATKMSKLDKNRASKFSDSERKKAQEDFVVHAWLSNWDAVGMGGDNQGVINGVPTSLDLGGTLAYRAQGGPKGAAFGDKVGELDSLRSKSMNPDSARFFGGMSDADMAKSAAKVTKIPDNAIRATIEKAGGSKELADKMIARKNDIAKRFGMAQDEAPFEEGKHPRAPDGKFGSKGSSASSTEAKPKHSSQVAFVTLRTELKATTDKTKKVAIAKQLVHGYALKAVELFKQGKDELGKTAIKKLEKYGKHATKEDVAAAHELIKKSGDAYKPEAAPAYTVKPIEETPAASKPNAPASSIEGKAKAAFEKKYAAKGYKFENAPADTQQMYIGFEKELASFTSSMSSEETEAFKDLASITGSAKNLVAKATSKIKASSKLSGLSPAQGAHILAYSGHEYSETNSALRAGVMDEKRWNHVRQLNKALDKLPNHEGVVYRKASLEPEIAAMYKPGMIVEERGFTSTSKVEGTWSGSFKYKITSKTGKDISKMSLHPGENEVLFQSGSRFKVTERVGNIIHMEQVE